MNNDPPVGRLAPSPTGAQHVGNARTYLLAWLSIRARHGRLLMRIEDLDSPRIKAWAAQQALDDLAWLGLDWDEGPDRGGPHAPYVQTARLDHYAAAFEQLRRAERIYPCTCSRSDLGDALSAPHVGQERPRYPGTCSHRSASDADSLGERPFAWRFRTTDEPVTFVDRVAGPQSRRVAAELGDFILAKRDGTPAYQLAVVVDDHAMGVTEVLRGDDLLPSTFRQLDLYRFFGWQPPEFAHVPLVIGSDGRRLAKRHGDSRMSVLRERGQGPERLLGLLAQSCGLRPSAEPVQARELLAGFDLSKLTHQPFTFTAEMWQALLANNR